eukprot:EG_transcript_621
MQAIVDYCGSNLQLLKLRLFHCLGVCVTEEETEAVLHASPPSVESLILDHKKKWPAEWLTTSTLHEAQKPCDELDILFRCFLEEFTSRLRVSREHHQSLTGEVIIDYPTLYEATAGKADAAARQLDDAVRSCQQAMGKVEHLERQRRALQQLGDEHRQQFFTELLLLKEHLHEAQVKLSQVARVNVVRQAAQIVDFLDFPTLGPVGGTVSSHEVRQMASDLSRAREELEFEKRRAAERGEFISALEVEVQRLREEADWYRATYGTPSSCSALSLQPSVGANSPDANDDPPLSLLGSSVSGSNPASPRMQHTFSARFRPAPDLYVKTVQREALNRWPAAPQRPADVRAGKPAERLPGATHRLVGGVGGRLVAAPAGPRLETPKSLPAPTPQPAAEGAKGKGPETRRDRDKEKERAKDRDREKAKDSARREKDDAPRAAPPPPSVPEEARPVARLQRRESNAAPMAPKVDARRPSIPSPKQDSDHLDSVVGDLPLTALTSPKQPSPTRRGARRPTKSILRTEEGPRRRKKTRLGKVTLHPYEVAGAAGAALTPSPTKPSVLLPLSPRSPRHAHSPRAADRLSPISRVLSLQVAALEKQLEAAQSTIHRLRQQLDEQKESGDKQDTSKESTPPENPTAALMEALAAENADLKYRLADTERRIHKWEELYKEELERQPGLDGPHPGEPSARGPDSPLLRRVPGTAPAAAGSTSALAAASALHSSTAVAGHASGSPKSPAVTSVLQPETMGPREEEAASGDKANGPEMASESSGQDAEPSLPAAASPPAWPLLSMPLPAEYCKACGKLTEKCQRLAQGAEKLKAELTTLRTQLSTERTKGLALGKDCAAWEKRVRSLNAQKRQWLQERLAWEQHAAALVRCLPGDAVVPPPPPGLVKRLWSLPLSLGPAPHDLPCGGAIPCVRSAKRGSLPLPPPSPPAPTPAGQSLAGLSPAAPALPGDHSVAEPGNPAGLPPTPSTPPPQPASPELVPSAAMAAAYTPTVTMPTTVVAVSEEADWEKVHDDEIEAILEAELPCYSLEDDPDPEGEGWAQWRLRQPLERMDPWRRAAMDRFLLYTFPGFEHAADLYDVFELFALLHLELLALLALRQRLEEERQARVDRGSTGPTELALLEERRALVSQCAVCRGIETYAGLLLVKVRRQKLALVQQRGDQVAALLAAIGALEAAHPQQALWLRQQVKEAEAEAEAEEQQAAPDGEPPDPPSPRSPAAVRTPARDRPASPAHAAPPRLGHGKARKVRAATVS